MDLNDYVFFKLDQESTLKPFDCGDKDLNDFLSEKAKLYLKENLATTYILESDAITIAYYSILNDSLNIEEEEYASKSQLTRFLKSLVGFGKRHLRSYPAIKIGRLAISKSIQSKGLGRILVNNIIEQAITLNRDCSCKLLTVDAYSQSVRFYEKMNFDFLSSADEGQSERQMYLDLSSLIELSEEEN